MDPSPTGSRPTQPHTGTTAAAAETVAKIARSSSMSTSEPRPLVSVITIFLDEERFLGEAIESVLAQTYERWELFLVDDGSSDGSSSIARGLADRHPAVHFLEHPAHENRGMSTSRNLGLRHARGEYVAFLDADDVWRADKLERQVAILEAEPDAAMVQGAPLWWHGWTGVPDDVRKDRVMKAPVTDVLVAPPAVLAGVFEGDTIASWPSDAMIRRTVVDAVGGFEEVFRGMYEDQAFFSKVQLRYPVYVSGESWLKYRIHADSCYSTSKRTDRTRSARRFFLYWFASYLANQKEVDPEILRLVERELRPFRLSSRIRKRVGRIVKAIRSLRA
jgi:glycosyltransferase involved in cell wall biosynthesis